jgi:hypothetical protein
VSDLDRQIEQLQRCETIKASGRGLGEERRAGERGER